jgi:hypothetical protein
MGCSPSRHAPGIPGFPPVQCLGNSVTLVCAWGFIIDKRMTPVKKAPAIALSESLPPIRSIVHRLAALPAAEGAGFSAARI